MLYTIFVSFRFIFNSVILIKSNLINNEINKPNCICVNNFKIKNIKITDFKLRLTIVINNGLVKS